MKFRIFAIIFTLVFLSACGAAQTSTDAPPDEAPPPGQLAAVELRDGRAVGVDVNGDPVNATLAEMLEVLSDRAHFDYDRFNIRNGEDRNLVDIYAALLKQNDGVTMVIEGHCDERGTREYNLALGERRANTVYSRIISQGVASDRLRKVSYGKERPEALGSNEDAWQKNRRGVMLLFNY